MIELHPFDDFPYHQAIRPAGSPEISDTRFNDGYYFATYAPGIHVFCGLRFHPNNNVVDGYAGMVLDGKQTGWRSSRALDGDRALLAVGPLRIEIVEPMNVQRVWAEPTEVGGETVGFDLEFRASAPAFVETPDIQYRYGRVLNHVLRYTQPARVSGTVTSSSGVRSVERWFGARDHSWGLRNSMGPHHRVGGSQVVASDPRAMRLWVPFEAGGLAGFFHLHRDAAGRLLDVEGRIHESGNMNDVGRAVIDVQHSIEYLPGTNRLARVEFQLCCEDGSREHLEAEVVCAPAHPQGFGYARGWSDEQNPGVWRGQAVFEGESFRVDDPFVTAGPPHTDEHRRLGGTEFACSAHHSSGAGMAHVEHMLYP